MTTLTQTIAKAHYVANEQQIETLARERAQFQEGMNGSDTVYHRAFIVMMQSRLGRPTRGRGPRARGKTVESMQEAQLAVLEAVDKVYYAAVLRGIVTPDIAYEEGLEAEEQRRRSRIRNSKTNFARSTKSEIRYFIEGGGDVRAVDAETVTKNAIRRSVQAPEPTDKVARQVSRAHGALIRALTRRIRNDPDSARAEAENIISELEKLLEGIEGEAEHEPSETTVVGARPPDRGAARTRVGVPMLHRGAG